MSFINPTAETNLSNQQGLCFPVYCLKGHRPCKQEAQTAHRVRLNTLHLTEGTLNKPHQPPLPLPQDPVVCLQLITSSLKTQTQSTLSEPLIHHHSKDAPETRGQAPSLAQRKQQARVGRPLPGLVEAAGEPLGLHLVPVDEDPHPGINVEHGSIGAEGAALWLPGGGGMEGAVTLPPPAQPKAWADSLSAGSPPPISASLAALRGASSCGHHIPPPLTSLAQTPKLVPPPHHGPGNSSPLSRPRSLPHSS